jgi:site-specific recombinase XerD
MSQNNSQIYLSQLIIDFLEYLEIEQNRSQHTIRNYHLYLNRLVEFWGDEPISKLKPEVIRKYRLWLNRLKGKDGENLSVATINYHLIALRHMLKYCAKVDIEALPPEKIELASATRKEVTFLNQEELARLFAQPKTTELAGLRDLAILELLYSTGLRVSELTKLNKEHVNLELGEFTIRGKRQKDRPVFITDSAKQILKGYLQKRTDDSPPLFIRLGGTKKADTSGDYLRLTPRSIQRIIQKYALLAGITKHVSPHTLRHSFATNLLMNGADLRSVQSLLGHSNIATTQVYTHITDPHLKAVHQKFHSGNQKPQKQL